MRRSDDKRESELTERLLGSIVSRAKGYWNIEVTWGEEDTVDQALLKLSEADALVIMGGPDISPDFYEGEVDYPNATPHFPRSDAAQLALIREAVATHTPTLGICRGMQALNVAQKGTLTQDISGQPGHSSDSLMDDFEFARHTVNIAAGSQLAQVLGCCRSGPFPTDGIRTMIHSAHHQAVDILGHELVVVARADDGTVEAIEHLYAPIVGVQWHPEDPDADPAMLDCFLARMCSLRTQSVAA
ncbi:gamma-glutamyl-gamma-aminobutyrate hydrolase family protein [Actinomyces minihominis]|uniref:gamma-glutamyl-gamma-aminobutyrate hydrolase family protein n=1 Tax=Actinomyces minihominis TaxID=2002838 RepID=UPI0013ED4AF4|nr:gamma-glutamyl-gamma-aminobutyrate hydrolase family protein [Actinomyces minihominis]